VHGIALATFNVKDYTDFAAHEGLQLVDAGRVRSVRDHGPASPSPQ
jgi:hypothetical protein